MSRTPAERAFIHGYILVANTVANVILSPEDPTFDDILAENRHAWDQSRLYHEAHITVEPATDRTFDQFRMAWTDDQWRVSAFSEDDVDDIQGKWFITSRHESYAALADMVRAQVEALEGGGLTVQRYKIEDTLLDSKHGDSLFPRMLTAIEIAQTTLRSHAEQDGDVLVTAADRPVIHELLETVSHDVGFSAGHETYSIPIAWAGYLDERHEAAVAELSEEERQTLAIGEETEMLAIATRSGLLSRISHFLSAFHSDFDDEDYKPEDMN